MSCRGRTASSTCSPTRRTASCCGCGRRSDSGALRPAIPFAVEREDVARRQLAMGVVEIADIIGHAGVVVVLALDLQRPAIANLPALPGGMDVADRGGAEDLRLRIAGAA